MFRYLHISGRQSWWRWLNFQPNWKNFNWKMLVDWLERVLCLSGWPHNYYYRRRCCCCCCFFLSLHIEMMKPVPCFHQDAKCRQGFFRVPLFPVSVLLHCCFVAVPFSFFDLAARKKKHIVNSKFFFISCYRCTAFLAAEPSKKSII